MHVCPQLAQNLTLTNELGNWTSDCAMRLAVTLRSASSATKTGHLPPSSSVTGVKCLAAAAITTLPMRVLPV
jgi:hypothetical protein